MQRSYRPHRRSFAGSVFYFGQQRLRRRRCCPPSKTRVHKVERGIVSPSGARGCGNPLQESPCYRRPVRSPEVVCARTPAADKDPVTLSTATAHETRCAVLAPV